MTTAIQYHSGNRYIISYDVGMSTVGVPQQYNRTSATIDTQIEWIQEYLPTSVDQRWAEEVERMRHQIIQELGVSYAEPGMISVSSTDQNGSTYVAPPAYASIDDREEAEAQVALILLMRRFPEAIAMVKRAVERGLIDGRTFGEELTYYWGHKAPHMLPSCCIIGWVMRATGIESHNDPKLGRHTMQALEHYIISVYPGETHKTSKELAVLHETLTRLEVEYQERLLSLAEVLA